MTARNDVTGDAMVSRVTTDAYRDNWERIFGKNKAEKQGEEERDDDSKDEKSET